MKKLLLAACITAAVNTAPALAYEAGDWVARGGLTLVSPKSDGSDNIQVPALGGDTGMQVEVDDNIQLGLNLVYFYNANWAVELLAATPFSHTIDLKNSALGLGDGELAETKHLPPTVSALYYFASNSTFKPYLGLGINYTTFFSEEFTSERQEQGFNSLSLDDSWGIGVQAGFDVALDDSWHINASARYITIDTTAEFKVGDIAGSVDVAIDPWVLSLTAGYTF